MAIIRRLTYFDYPKLKQLISYLCNDEKDKLAKSLIEEPIGIVNAMLPLSLKFKSESFILIQNNEILGLITTVLTPGNCTKVSISRLIFKDNMYDVAKELVQFVVQKFGNKGANSFTVTIDECHDELFNLFINGCGFRQCASETLWKIEDFEIPQSSLVWEYAQDSDAKLVANLYNSQVLNIYKPSMERHYKEFQTPFFEGFTDYYKTRFLIRGADGLNGYFSVTTGDNLNYILDITTNSAFDFDYDAILHVMLSVIAKKKKLFFPLIKQKKYIAESEKFEKYLQSKNYIPIRTQQILVKDFYRPIKEESSVWNVFVLGENEVSGIGQELNSPSKPET